MCNARVEACFDDFSVHRHTTTSHTSTPLAHPAPQAGWKTAEAEHGKAAKQFATAPHFCRRHLPRAVWIVFYRPRDHLGSHSPNYVGNDVFTRATKDVKDVVTWPLSHSCLN